MKLTLKGDTMKTLEEIKAIFRESEDEIKDKFWELIKSNNLEAVKEFLKDYPIPEIFFEKWFQNSWTRKVQLEPFFPSPLVLAHAGLAYEKDKSFAMIEYFESLGLKADDQYDWWNALSGYIDWGGKNPKVIEYFLGKGATFETYTEYGNTPIHNWALFGKPKKLEVALKAGANIEMKSIKTDNELRVGWNHIDATPLYEAVTDDERVASCTGILLKYGAEVNAVHCSLNDDGTWFAIRSILDVAYGGKNKKLLKEAGAKTWKQLVKEYNIDTSLELSEQYRIYNELLEKKKKAK
jgi:hypothetical protein